MALSKTDAICTKCKKMFYSILTRSFLGFQNTTCPHCQEKLTYPLTTGYRTTYQILLGLMIVIILTQFGQGGFGYPGGIGLAIMYALYRDWSIRKSMRNAQPNTSGLAEITSNSLPRPSNEKSRLKKMLSGIGVAALLIAGAIGSGIGQFFGESIFSPNRTTSDQMQDSLAEAARRINSRGAIMVDQYTRMDGATVESGSRLVYHYTLPGYLSKDIDSATLMKNILPALRKGACSNKDMRLSMDYGATYVYSYSGSDGVKIASFDVTKDSCSP